jgi:hypothetical protein
MMEQMCETGCGREATGRYWTEPGCIEWRCHEHRRPDVVTPARDTEPAPGPENAGAAQLGALSEELQQRILERLQRVPIYTGTPSPHRITTPDVSHMRTIDVHLPAFCTICHAPTPATCLSDDGHSCIYCYRRGQYRHEQTGGEGLDERIAAAKVDEFPVGEFEALPGWDDQP